MVRKCGSGWPWGPKAASDNEWEGEKLWGHQVQTPARYLPGTCPGRVICATVFSSVEGTIISILRDY